MKENNLTVFRNRLKKLGIETEYFGNIPWVYLDKINGKRVIEKFHSEHYFTVGFLEKGGGVNFTDLKTIFNLIRKYR